MEKIIQGAIKDQVVDAVREWMDKNPAESIKAEVFKMLDSRKSEIVRKLLGFNIRWGGKRNPLDNI